MNGHKVGVLSDANSFLEPLITRLSIIVRQISRCKIGVKFEVFADQCEKHVVNWPGPRKAQTSSAAVFGHGNERFSWTNLPRCRFRPWEWAVFVDELAPLPVLAMEMGDFRGRTWDIVQKYVLGADVL